MVAALAGGKVIAMKSPAYSSIVKHLSSVRHLDLHQVTIQNAHV